MDRFPARRALAVAVLVVAGLLATVLTIATFGSTSADAQPTEPARISVSSHEISQNGEEVIATVSLDPGSTVPGAVAATLLFDPVQVQLLECVAGGVVTCNAPTEGEARFAAVNAVGWAEPATLIEVRFSTLHLSVGSDLTVAVDDLYDIHAVPITSVEVVSGSIGFAVTEPTAVDDPSVPVTEPTAVDDPSVPDTGAPAVDDPSVPVTEPAPVEPPVPTTGGSISGTVIASGGQAVAGAEVCATRPVVLVRTCTTTDPTGRYRLTALDTANYRLTATDPEARYADSAPIHLGVVSPSARTGIDIVLR